MADLKPITSPDNPKVKEAARLRDRRGRKKSGRFLVEGAREVEKALAAGLRPETVFLVEALTAGSSVAAAAVASAERSFAVTTPVYAKLAVREERDGLLAVFPVPPHRPERLHLPRKALLLAASGIEKPGNVGALLRSADAFGVDAFAMEGGTDLWNPNVVRASLGCVFTVPLATFSPGELLPWLRRTGARLVAATPDGDVAPADVDLRGPTAIVLGSEERGVGPELLEAADVRLRIPMRGAADSLNVSVTAGIVLYEADRQRRSS